MCHGLKWTCNDCWPKPVFEVGKKYKRTTTNTHRLWSCIAVIRDHVILVDEEWPTAVSSILQTSRKEYKEFVPPLQASQEMYLIKEASGTTVWLSETSYSTLFGYKCIGKKTLTITEGEGL